MRADGLIFVRSRKPWLDLPIRAFEGGDAGHVAVQIDGEIVDTTLSQRGVKRQPREDFLARYDVVDEVPVVLPNPRVANDWLRRQVGKPYDWTAIAGFVLWRDWQDEDRWYCSELAASWMREGGARMAEQYRRIGVRLIHEVSYARAAGRLWLQDKEAPV